MWITNFSQTLQPFLVLVFTFLYIIRWSVIFLPSLHLLWLLSSYSNLYWFLSSVTETAIFSSDHPWNSFAFLLYWISSLLDSMPSLLVYFFVLLGWHLFWEKVHGRQMVFRPFRPKRMSLLPLLLLITFVGYRIVDRKLFSLRILKVLFHCFFFFNY